MNSQRLQHDAEESVQVDIVCSDYEKSVELLPRLALRTLLNLSQKMTVYYSPEGRKLILVDYYWSNSLQSEGQYEYD